MLGQRQELDMREAQVGKIGGQLRRELAIGQKHAAVAAAPGAGVHLVDRKRRGKRVAPASRRHPFAVAPFEIEVPHA
jgi:hypothetical protein